MTTHTQLTSFELAYTDTVADLDQITSLDWIPVAAPGEVHAALIAAGRLPHPYRDQNEKAARWVEEKTWWYRTAFDAPADIAAGERLRLVFQGLDTVATIWLNGQELGHHENMFRPAVFDITDAISPNNELVLRFTPPLYGVTAPADMVETAKRAAIGFAAMAPAAVAAAKDAEPSGALFGNLAMALRRKPTYSWGWDFGPRLPSIGIWKPVELVREHGAVITAHHIATRALDVDGCTATVTLNVQTSAPAVVKVALTSPSGVAATGSVTSNGNDPAELTLALTDVEPWWTHDLGTPALYDLTITTPDDEINTRAGIRTIALDRSPDPGGGRLFRFVLNGRPIYARGAGMTPTTMMQGTTRPAYYRRLAELAADGNMNMIRVWGGGIYEDDAFYDAADELGLLVWQDFLFACMDYPSEDPAFAAEVASEAEYQVKRLRNHPSLALWAGNNEVHALHEVAYHNLDPGNWGYSFFHRLFPALIGAHSPEIPYWPGSPWGQDDPFGVNGVADGDRHAWEVWHGVNVGATSPETYASQGEAMHFARYKYDTGKFISEFGLQSAPVRATLERWISPDQLTMHSPAFDAHIKDTPKYKGDDLLAVETGLPDDVDSYVDFTMATQAEGLKFGIEHYRRRQPHNSGALIWQLNDPWPGMTWSIIDSDLVPKAGYFFAQRAFAPTIASFLLTDTDLQLWVTNSGPSTVSTTLDVEVTGIAGGPILSDAVVASVAAGGSEIVWSTPADSIGAGPNRVARVSGHGVPTNRLFFAHLKDIDWPPSTIDVTVTGPAEVTLTAHGYCYFAHLELAAAQTGSSPPKARFADNYLDLRDGESIAIVIDGLSAPAAPEMFTARVYAAQARIAR